MPDLSDTVAKCRMGTAKKFYTSIASLSHTRKVTRNKTVDGGRWHRTDWNKPDSTACNFVWINKWVE